MTFFEPKEDVIDIEITQFGKHLLATGKWKPYYYSFFDDDILYDSKYGGVTELQNDSQDRIVTNARQKAQYAFAGIETEIKKQYSRLPRNGNEYEKTNLQPTMDRDYALSLPLGRADIGNQNAAAWAVTFLHGELDSAVPYSTSSLGILPIVKMSSKDVIFRTSVKNRNEEEARALSLTGALNQVGEQVEPSDLIFANTIYKDGSYVSIEEDYLLMEMLEKNTPFEEENLDIEVFVHEENQKGQPVLTPLKFMKKKKMVVNDILLDDDDPELNQQDELSPDYVEYFFNVWVDDEIDLETLCKSVVRRRNLGLYTPPIQCPDTIPLVGGGGDYECNPEIEECDDGKCPDLEPCEDEGTT